MESEETLSDNVWGVAMKVVPEKVMKFGLNAVADTYHIDPTLTSGGR